VVALIGGRTSRAWVALMLTCNVGTHAGTRAPVNLVWPRGEVARSCSEPVFDALLRTLIVPGDFSPNRCLTCAQRARVSEAAESAGMRSHQALSLRKLLLTERAIGRTGGLRSQPRREAALCRTYEAGTSLVETARAADVPPVALFRAVLRARFKGLCGAKALREQIRRTLREPECHLSERDCAELAAAMPLDAVAYAAECDLYGQRRGAYRLERALQRLLEERGMAFLTEDDQRQRHLGVAGPLPSTPDVLLGPEGALINGERVQ